MPQIDLTKHVVGLSGGKDSTALALWLVENEPREYEFICNRTGNELPARGAVKARALVAEEIARAKQVVLAATPPAKSEPSVLERLAALEKQAIAQAESMSKLLPTIAANTEATRDLLRRIVR